jgi:AcrR family transcriptional regulator
MASTQKRRATTTADKSQTWRPGQAVHPAFDRDDQFQKRKQALVQIAIHFFNSRGYHATSMEAIAAEVGLTKGTLYHYYDSKTDLAYDCMLESIADGHRMAQQAAAGGGTGLDKLECYLRLQFETLAGRRGSSWLHADMSVLRDAQRAEARRRSRTVDALVQGFLAAGIADGSIAPVDPKIAEFFLMGALNWLPRWYSPSGAMNSGDLAAVFIRMMFDGLRAR